MLILNLNPGQIAELSRECLDALLKMGNVSFDLRPEQRFHAAAGKLRLQLIHCPGRVPQQACKCRCDARLRPCAFEDDAIEYLNLIEPVALGLKELPPLVDGRFDDWVVVVCEGDLGPVLLEQVLIDVKAGAKGLQRSLQPFDGIFLFRMVEALVVHAGDTQHNAHIAALGKKHCSIPKPIQVDVVVERGSLFPRLDDLIKSQHQITSTRGTLCFAAS